MTVVGVGAVVVVGASVVEVAGPVVVGLQLKLSHGVKLPSCEQKRP